MSCNEGEGVPGIITANFSENPPGLALLNATQVTTTTLAGIGLLAVVGNRLVMSNVPTTLQVYSINQDGSVALASSVTDSLATYPYSIVAAEQSLPASRQASPQYSWRDHFRLQSLSLH